MNDKNVRKAIYFDLDTNSLLTIFPKGTRTPYSEIKKFMIKREFNHRQYSGYDSINAMSHAQVVKVIKDLSREFPWLSKCLKKLDVTDIGKEYDLLMVVKNANIRNNTVNHADLKTQKKPIKDIMDNAIQRANDQQIYNKIDNEKKRTASEFSDR